MAGDFGGEGVFLQGLANGLRTSAAYAAGKFAVVLIPDDTRSLFMSSAP